VNGPQPTRGTLHVRRRRSLALVCPASVAVCDDHGLRGSGPRPILGLETLDFSRFPPTRRCDRLLHPAFSPLQAPVGDRGCAAVIRQVIPRATAAQAMGAVLSARATDTTMRGRLPGRPWIRGFARAAFEQHGTDLAPITSGRRMQASPWRPVRPSRVLPPVEVCRGTSRAKPRTPGRSGTPRDRATVVASGPVPGTPARRWPTGSALLPGQDTRADLADALLDLLRLRPQEPDQVPGRLGRLAVLLQAGRQPPMFQGRCASSTPNPASCPRMALTTLWASIKDQPQAAQSSRAWISISGLTFHPTDLKTRLTIYLRYP
jgi:hypothetical protein